MPSQPNSPSAATKVAEKGLTAGAVGQLSKDGRAKEKEKERRQDTNHPGCTVRTPSSGSRLSGVPYAAVQTQQAILNAIVSLIPELTLESLGVLWKEVRVEIGRKEKLTQALPSGPQ
ncbi:hypothetical protein TraAM80_00650 [Trypanosoma rangeli]|uniref:Uncharacterized protein n=1 Tax=Trypanosoma rangeli TaxID=5698 RepID=A0A3R7KXT1_TRYRA|nr:uncharacterized protein TraAM80_00650 [Trypanosoma rangeli]RNF11816.1 hypothetical protein TraAM80_00650 [Trypanosoma rangeli]|eukprot:RNF11816.1 hypothetical protein TraAM80_00650 [Trypanosoma rangeli]